MKKTLAVIAGGRTIDHRLSLESAHTLVAALEGSSFEPTLLTISETGAWSDIDERGSRTPDDHASRVRALEMLQRFDYALPLIHGPEVAGLISALGVPLLGERAGGIAACIDKPLARRLLSQAGLPVLPSMTITRAALAARPREVLELARQRIGFPCLVKPASGAASAGVEVADSRSELIPALLRAAAFDSRILIEPFLDVREIEVEVIAERPSLPGELVFRTPILDHATRTTPGAIELVVPAMVGAEEREQMQALAVSAYRALSLEAIGRVELLRDRDTGGVWINEVNPLPTFASGSVFSRLLAASGQSPADVVARLTTAAEARLREDFRTRHAAL